MMNTEVTINKRAVEGIRDADKGHQLLSYFAYYYRGGGVDLDARISSVYNPLQIKEKSPEPTEKAKKIHDIVAKLPKRDRQVVFEYYMPRDENFPHVEEIAARFKVYRRTFYKWLYSVRVNVAKEYQKTN